MQEENLLPNPKEEESEEGFEEEPLSEKIERETSRLDPDPIKYYKKRIMKLYGWIWALLGIVALLFLVIVLAKLI